MAISWYEEDTRYRPSPGRPVLDRSRKVDSIPEPAPDDRRHGSDQSTREVVRRPSRSTVG